MEIQNDDDNSAHMCSNVTNVLLRQALFESEEYGNFLSAYMCFLRAAECEGMELRGSNEEELKSAFYGCVDCSDFCASSCLTLLVILSSS